MPKSSKTKKRTFVLDTNVLIHDPNAIFNFDEHDVVIPITVVEELDRLKSGNESRNVSARQASRNLTKLIKEDPEMNRLPVIIFSSLVNDDMRRKGELLGADAQMSKPEIGSLVKVLDEIIAKYKNET